MDSVCPRTMAMTPDTFVDALYVIKGYLLELTRALYRSRVAIYIATVELTLNTGFFKRCLSEFGPSKR